MEALEASSPPRLTVNLACNIMRNAVIGIPIMTVIVRVGTEE